ncbi:MAG: P1 family peptidase [Anaerolineae bacterium]|nr:P1 family peptidase [Gemmatimonadaceae bacterium]
MKLLLLSFAMVSIAQAQTRARELGIPLDGTSGRLNAITDVAGVEVGHTTLISGSGRLVEGRGPVRTGVTAILPRGRAGSDTVFAAWFTLNGNGEMTGTTWMEESGMLEGPVLITNTHSVGVVRDAVIDWMVKTGRSRLFALPVVAETFDGALNDDKGFHVKSEHVFSALNAASAGAVQEGAVGGGTGMICHGFKGGIGTASRKLSDAAGGFTVGVLVQCNYGARRLLRVAGAPVGTEISDLRPCYETNEPPTREWLRGVPHCGAAPPAGTPRDENLEGLGSIIIVVATDAPLLPHQLKRVATRASLGVGRMGGLGENSSGDIFLAFSTANPAAAADTGIAALRMLPNDRINPIFEATVQATEEAILNAMLAARTMVGVDGLRVSAIPHDRLLAALRKHNRMGEGAKR